MVMGLLLRFVILDLPESLKNFKFQEKIKNRVTMIGRKINSFPKRERPKSNSQNNSLLNKKRKKVLSDPILKKSKQKKKMNLAFPNLQK
jgi:hypothetical protein